MIKFGKETVLRLHASLAGMTGGDAGVRDCGLLESALASPFQTFDGKELFPSNEEKAAKYCYALISDHAFVDGNKRIGVCVMLTFLEACGIHIDPSNEDVYEVGMSVASGKMGYDDVTAWIRRYE